MKMFRIFCVVLAIGVVMSLVYETRHGLYRVLASYNLVPHEEGITELYFMDSDSLPERAGALSFTFAIRNLEGRDMVYPYVVYAEFPDRRVELQRDVVPVAAGERSLTRVALRVERRGQGRIVVELPDHDQRIAFLVY